MNFAPVEGMTSYRDTLKQFEADCIFDKRQISEADYILLGRTRYTVPKEIWLIPIISDLIAQNRRTMNEILKFNGLSFYFKSEALSMSSNFWTDIYSTISECYQDIYKEKMDASLKSKLLQIKGPDLEIPESEILTFESYEQIVMGPGKNLLHAVYEIAKVTILRLDPIQSKETKKEIRQLDCLEYVQLVNHLEGNAPLVLASKNNGTALKAYNAIVKLLKDGFVEVTGQREAGDTILYINPAKEVIHVGLFKTPEIVESKWGKHPIFYHPPENLPYENSYIVMRG